MNIVILMLFIIEGSILGILAFVLRYKHSEYPDFRAGYHMAGSVLLIPIHFLNRKNHL